MAARHRVEITSPHNTDLEKEIEGLTGAAEASRTLLMKGVQHYAARFREQKRDTSPLVQVDASNNPTDPTVLERIPSRMYDVARPLGEVDAKLGVDLFELLKALTEGNSGPHLVFERGPGLGIAQYGLRTRQEKDPLLLNKNITFLGEVDHFHFKLTTLLHALLFIGADIPPELIKEFTGVLVMYLTNVKSFYPNLKESPEVLAHAILDRSIWEGLMETLNRKEIPDPRYIENPIVYEPSAEMRTLLEQFSKNPQAFFNENTGDINPLANTERYFGLRNGHTILGGDMGSFVPHLPPESVALSFGVRSTAWYREAATANPTEARERMVKLALATAHSLRPGGVDIDDWPRGFFDEEHYTGDLRAVAEAIARDRSLKDNTRLSVIWGPSDEHPDHWGLIPKSAVITRARKGRFPDIKVRAALLSTDRCSPGNLVRMTPHTLVPIGDKLKEIFENADPKKRGQETAKAYHRRLQRLLATLKMNRS